MNLPNPEILNKEYLSNKPFPYIAIDGVFHEDQLNRILYAWPKEHEFHTKNKFEVEKGGTTSESKMGPVISDFIHINFQSQEFILWLEKLTGITGLVFDCRKFALHETFPGGSLTPHLDYTISKVTGLQLRVNVLLYLNKDWKPEYNGNLDLYERQPMSGGDLLRATASIEPLFNRISIFSMNAATPAWHGHNKPLNCPLDMSRKSIALNYFTIPESKAYSERTLFSTEKNQFIKQFIPPIIWKIKNKIKAK